MFAEELWVSSVSFYFTNANQHEEDRQHSGLLVERRKPGFLAKI